MDKNRVKGKAKDIVGRVERQAGEWTGSEEHQLKGMGKQAEGKLQNAFGKAKDAIKNEADQTKRRDDARREEEHEGRRKTA
ncbi:MAG: CsbD family protein [Acidobacteria bacterium]|nr:CsbD family protein [Acidobacteriota bacterium]